MNQKEKLRDCVNSLLESDVEVEIIVVDNASKDGTSEMIKKEFKSVNLITNAKNLGFSKAHNQAMRESKGDFILVLNDDIVVKEFCLSTMVEFLEKNSRIGMVGCKFLFPDGSFQESSFKFPQKNLDWLKGRIVGSESVRSGRLHSTDYVMGAFMMMPRFVLEKVGLFDEQFFIFCEEIDLAYRIKKNGYEIWYNPEGEIIHSHGVTTRHHQSKEVRLWFRTLGFKNMFRWYKKHYGTWSMMVYKLRALIAILVRRDEDREIWKRKIKTVFEGLENRPQINSLILFI